MKRTVIRTAAAAAAFIVSVSISVNLYGGVQPGVQPGSRHTDPSAPVPPVTAKWYVAHVTNTHSPDPFVTSRIYGPWRGSKGIMKAIEACGRLVTREMREQGWRCGAAPVMVMPRGRKTVMPLESGR